MKHFILAASLTALSLSISGCAQAGPNELKKAEVEKIIKDYLLENPEVIRDALIELEARADRDAIEAVSDQLFSDPRDVVIGPEDAKVTIVEFFDYNCGFCKNTTNWVKNVMDEYPNDVRIIFKELPILDNRTRTSRNAAKAALASARQGKYTTMHFALMKERVLNADRIREIAEETGLDMAKFEADMKDVTLDRHIEDTILLSNRLPMLTGTPFFMVNDNYVSGANLERLDQLLKEALRS